MRSRGLLPLAAAFALIGARPAPADPPAPREIVLDKDDIDVTGKVVVKPGTYRVRDLNGDGVIRVKGDGVTLVLDGVTLDGAPEGATPDTFEGVGVSVVGQAKCQVVGGAIRGFRVGLRGERTQAIEIRNLDVSGNRAMRLKSTPAREDESDWLWPHENDKAEWETRYGAGISLTDCLAASVARCRARGTQNGLLLTRSNQATVSDCDFSFLSGWGVAMYRSSKCRLVGNRCDFCVRGYSHGVYARGQDSAGILVFEQCSDNRFESNSATHSGDGFFLYAGHETTQRTGEGGCNRNHVVGNDFSQAVANGIEATFSEGNKFVANRLDECDHGLWAGYSYRTRVEANGIRRCANGISIEHGHHNEIVQNVIEDCALGIHLWWDDDKDLLRSAYGRAQDTSSSGNTISFNWIAGGATGLRFVSDTRSLVGRNWIAATKIALDAGGTTSFEVFDLNAAEAPVSVRCETAAPLELGRNHWSPWKTDGHQRVLPAEPLSRRIAIQKPPVETPTFLPQDVLRGRESIVIGEWGPLDPRLPALVPFARSGSAAATMRVVGAGLPFRVTSVTEGFDAVPAEGKGPATIRVRRVRNALDSSVAPWEASVRIGDRDFAARGLMVYAPWKVRWWAWTKDPREDAEAWKAMLATPPLYERTVDALDFSWGGGRPSEKVPADRFATVAETTLELPAGRWLLSTTSDDGIRVWVDGRLVLDDWTWHAPKDASVPLDLPAGRHTIRVEHFEIDGWAVLRSSLEPAADRR